MFHLVLKRLKDALLPENSRGGKHNAVTVSRRDLEMLLYHFERVDGEMRRLAAFKEAIDTAPQPTDVDLFDGLAGNWRDPVTDVHVDLYQLMRQPPLSSAIREIVQHAMAKQFKPTADPAHVPAKRTHVDDFIDNSWAARHTPEDLTYARFVLNYFRLPATLKNDFWPIMKEHKLFCTHNGQRYRVVAASRMGDVCLSHDLSEEHTYGLRVYPNECTSWSSQP